MSPISSTCALLLSLLVVQDPKNVDAARAAGEKAWAAHDEPAVIQAYQVVTAAAPDDIVAWHRLGYALHGAKRYEEALAADQRGAALHERDPKTGGICTYNVACALSMLGKKSEALDWLERAVERGFRNDGMMGWDPELEPIRSEVRFAKIIEGLQAKRLQVAIVVHEGVELLDFAGPAEVFDHADDRDGESMFRVFLVAPTPGAVSAQGTAKIVPAFTIADCPTPDVIVIPGGDTTRLTKDATFLAWVRDSLPRAKTLLTVCTGVFVPAKLGLLDGKEATTHHGSLKGLQRQYPAIRVRDDVKVVDNGKIVTAAGISSGIDGALHVVAKLAGVGSARSVARSIEYRWQPEADGAEAVT
ncbi:MAG TPA: DJ-1/PfpI family protein, partial [Planctomycetota bacterium]|nr:DJ-1/PfpI family protein [Planctomycetota bacterium]